MYTIKPSYSYFVLKCLMSSLLFMLIFSAIMLIFKNYEFRYLIPVFLIAMYFGVLLIYFPLKFKSTCYQIKNTSITVTSGVIFKYTSYISYGSINYIEKRQNILQKPCGTYTLILYGMGNKNYIRDVSVYAVKIVEIKINGRQGL